MYLHFFSFSERPFDITPDTRFRYPSPQHEEVIDSLLYGIRERRGFMVLTGEVGTGKTTSIRTLLSRIGSDVDTALIINPVLSTLELLQMINKDFGVSTEGSPSVLQQMEALNQFLLSRAQEGRNAVVIIDEAQDLSFEALEMVRLLSNLETETRKLLQLIMVGQPELEFKLSSPVLRQLQQRIQIHSVLKPLNPEETKSYIFFRLQQVSPHSCLDFQPSALRKIHVFSGGIPRLINKVCELTLLAAYLDDTHVITKKLVERAFEEMGRQFWTHTSELEPWRRHVPSA